MEVDQILGHLETQNTHVVRQSFNQLLVETTYSANPALGDKMNVVQKRYGFGPNNF